MGLQSFLNMVGCGMWSNRVEAAHAAGGRLQQPAPLGHCADFCQAQDRDRIDLQDSKVLTAL